MNCDAFNVGVGSVNIRQEKAARVTIESSERVLVQADGEFLGECPASFWIVPSALTIVA